MTITNGRQAVDYFFDLALYLFVATVFLAVAATRKLDAPTVLIVAAALAVRGLAFLNFTKIHLDPRTVRYITSFYIPFYIADFFIISGSFVSATGHMLFFLLVMKLFSAETNRDYVYLGIMAFMEMLLAAILTIDAAFMGLFAIFLLFGIATFASFEIKRGYTISEQTRGRPAEITGPPQAFLRGIGITAAFVTLGVLIAGGILFFFIPRVTTGYLSSFAQAQTISGFSDTVTLGDLGTIKQSSMVVMHVKINETPSGNTPVLRWRGKAYLNFDGHRWSDNTSSTMLSRFEAGKFYIPQSTAPGSRPDETVSYTVTREQMSTDILFLAPVPVSVSGRFRSLEIDLTDSILSRDSTYGTLRYDAVSNVGVPSAVLLRQAGSDYRDAGWQAFLQLPKMDPRIRELALEVTKNAGTPYDKAAAIELYLRTRLGYTLEMAATGPDPVADFLFRVRKGHCEYFASAMTVMLRSIDIPARQVGGFLSGEFNDLSQQYVVRGSDAHNWVEVLFPRYGWVSFDPTPSAGTQPSNGGLGSWNKWLDAAHTFWNDWVVAYDFSHQFTFFRQMDRGSRQMTNDSRQWVRQKYDALRTRLKTLHDGFMEDPMVFPLGVFLACTAGLLVLFGPRIVYLLRQVHSRARVRAGKVSARDVTLAYERFLTLMARRGIQRTPAMTPHELAEVAGQSPTDGAAIAPLVREFTVAFEEARYGGATGRLPELYRLLDKLERPPTVIK